MTYLILAIAAMTAATQITRWFPFLLFSRRRPPDRLLRGARLIPGAVMAVLVLTSLPFPENPAGIPGLADPASALAALSDPALWRPWLCAAAAAGLHLIFRQPLISIFGATGLYMVLPVLTA